MVGQPLYTHTHPPHTHTPPTHTHSHPPTHTHTHTLTPPHTHTHNPPYTHTHTHTEPARYSWLPRLLALRREEATAVWGEAYSPTVVWLVTSIVQAVLQREANFSDQWFGN